MRQVLVCLAFVAAFQLSGKSQLVKSNIFTRNPNPSYRLSADGKTLGMTATSDDGDTWMSFIDLTTNTWKPKGSISTRRAFISPDLKAAYSNGYSEKGFKGDGFLNKYDKFTSWYFPSNTDVSKVQFPDRHFILAVLGDGNLLTATDLKFKKSKHLMFHTITASELNITNPQTGEVVRNVFKDKPFEIVHDWLYQSAPQLADNDSLLLTSFYGTNWSVFRIYDGTFAAIRQAQPIALQAVSGRYGMGSHVVHLPYKTGEQPKSIAVRTVVDFQAGQTVLTDTVFLQQGRGYWVTAGAPNRFYTLHGGADVLRLEGWDGKRMVVLDSVLLPMNKTFANEQWKNIESGAFKLLVSEPTDQVLFLPTTSNQNNTGAYNRFLSWKLRSGDWAFESPQFIRESEAHIAQQQALANRQAAQQAARTFTLAPNLWVRKEAGGTPHRIVGKAPTGTLWNVVTYSLQKDNTWQISNETKSEFDLTYQCISINPKQCGQCNGAGKVGTVAQKTTEKTDKMIYNQITTRTTSNVYSTQSCGQCKGAGVLF